MTFCAFTARLTSPGESPFAYSACGSMSTLTVRCTPPNAGSTPAPCTVPSGMRMKFVPRSLSSASVRCGLATPSWRIGTSVALNRTMNGGEIPGGMMRVIPCDDAVSCAMPACTSASGWKYTLMMLSPFSDCDSMCSMSLT